MLPKAAEHDSHRSTGGCHLGWGMTKPLGTRRGEVGVGVGGWVRESSHVGTQAV